LPSPDHRLPGQTGLVPSNLQRNLKRYAFIAKKVLHRLTCLALPALGALQSAHAAPAVILNAGGRPLIARMGTQAPPARPLQVTVLPLALAAEAKGKGDTEDKAEPKIGSMAEHLAAAKAALAAQGPAPRLPDPGQGEPADIQLPPGQALLAQMVHPAPWNQEPLPLNLFDAETSAQVASLRYYAHPSGQAMLVGETCFPLDGSPRTVGLEWGRGEAPNLVMVVPPTPENAAVMNYSQLAVPPVTFEKLLFAMTLPGLSCVIL
jgi:hypothetical protein